MSTLNRKRLVIVIDYTEYGDAPPDLSEVALMAELGLEKTVGADLDATVFNDDKSAIAYIESQAVPAETSTPRGQYGYNDYRNEPIGGGNPYYRCAHCKRSDPEINGRLEGHEPWCPYRLAHENGEKYRPG